MKLSIDNSADIKSTNSQDEQVNFRIEASSTMFDTLTKNIYKNPKESLIRELISNAHDSHVAADNVNTPIDIHVPSEIEPYFEVRDYGTSMDYDQMVNVYTVFFKSSKNNTNNQIGGFGLGAKLPFAYQDQFTITTWLNGVHTEYLACKENGVPVLKTLFSCEEKEAKQGLSVRVPVYNQDIEIFRNILKDFSKYSNFNMNYNDKEFYCKSEVDKDMTDLFRQFNKRLSVYKQDKYASLAIRLGGVVYKVDPNDFLDEHIYEYVNQYFIERNFNQEQKDQLNKINCDNRFFKSFNNKGFMLDYDIGELQPTASRESLQLTKQQAIDIVFDMILLRKQIYQYVIEHKPEYEETPESKLECLEYYKKYADVIQSFGFYDQNLSIENLKIFGSPISLSCLLMINVSNFNNNYNVENFKVKNAKILQRNEFGKADITNEAKMKSNITVIVTHETIADIRNSNFNDNWNKNDLDEDTIAVIQLCKRNNIDEYINQFKSKYPIESKFFVFKKLPEDFQTKNVKKERSKTQSKDICEEAFINRHLGIFNEVGYIPIFRYESASFERALRKLNIPVYTPETQKEFKKISKYSCCKVIDCEDDIIKKHLKEAMQKMMLSIIYSTSYKIRNFIEMFPDKKPKFVKNLESSLGPIEDNFFSYSTTCDMLEFLKIVDNEHYLQYWSLYDNLVDIVIKCWSEDDKFIYKCVDLQQMKLFAESRKGKTITITL